MFGIFYSFCSWLFCFRELMVTTGQKEQQVHEDRRDDEDQTEPRDQSEMLESQDHEDLAPPPKLR